MGLPWPTWATPETGCDVAGLHSLHMLPFVHWVLVWGLILLVEIAETLGVTTLVQVVVVVKAISVEVWCCCPC